MNHNAPETSARPAYVDAVLEGGPADIPAGQRYRQVSAGDLTFKLPHRDGYEHFECTGERLEGADGQRRSIYRWVSRTRVAE